MGLFSHRRDCGWTIISVVFLFSGWTGVLGIMLLLSPGGGVAWARESGVTDTTIQIGGVMDIQGDSLWRGIGSGMKVGIEAALKGEKANGRSIEFIVLNDSYEPEKSVEATRKLLAQGIFAMVGNVGSANAQAVLPLLAEAKTPAIGFYTGAAFLRRPDATYVLNFRPSYTQEIAAVVEAALAAGIKPDGICAYVQDDAFVMAGVEAIAQALNGKPNAAETVAALNQVVDAMKSNTNPQHWKTTIAPVGAYPRNALSTMEGYESLKKWEKATQRHCRFVVTAALYGNLSHFIGLVRTLKQEQWLFSALSVTGLTDLKQELRNNNKITNGVVATQVVPPLDSSLPIVQEVRDRLGRDFGYLTLESYMVGKLFLQILRATEGELTRENFMKTARSGKVFDLGGFKVDFKASNQGSNYVTLHSLNGENYDPITVNDMAKLLPP